MPRPSNREERRAQIVDGLMRVLPEHGYERASVARIGNGVMVSPYWAHGVYCWAVQHLLPDWLMIRLALKLHKQVRFHPKNKQKMEEKKTK